jgi:L-amino acid N-acyltransferase YncA
MALPIERAIVRTAAAGDLQAIVNIYNHHVLHTIVTFEEQAVSAPDIAKRMRDVEAASLPWLVAERNGSVEGYAYAAPWHPRRSYRFSAEVTVYVASDQTRKGLGTMLYAQLLSSLRSRQIHTALGGIALPNEASVALHEKFGFKKVAHLEAVGFKFNRWIDVGYWQRIL